MNSVPTNSNAIEVDEYGLLKDPKDWSEDLARKIARDIGIGLLTESHWRIIGGLREHYLRYGAPPVIHRVCQDAGVERGHVNELFGYCLNAWRVAGLPYPGEEAASYLSNM